MEKIYDFLKYRHYFLGLTFVLFAVLLSLTIMKGGFNWGIDFAGGVKLVVQFDKDVNITGIREALSSKKISAEVQQIGKEEQNEYIIGTKLTGKTENTEQNYIFIRDALSESFKKFEILSVETVGPAIGAYLIKSALYSIIAVLALMMVYLAFRFEIKYSIGAIVALIHDITLSILFCGSVGLELNIPVVAAILTILGYSINDTIVIFDRIRENVTIESKQTFTEIINKSVTQSLSRTLLTSLTTLFAVLAIFLLGGDTISDFGLVLIFGIVVGTYSSTYIASPVVLKWEKMTA